MSELCIVAIDWTGRSSHDQRRTLWLAAATDGGLVRLESGQTRTVGGAATQLWVGRSVR